MVTPYVNIQDLILTILAIIVLVIMLGSLYALLAAIFKFVFAAGDPDKVKAAQNSIRYMVIGVIFTLLLLFFFPVIFEKLNIPGYEVFTARNIFAKVGEILSYLFELGGLVDFSGGNPGGATNGGGDYTL